MNRKQRRAVALTSRSGSANPLAAAAELFIEAVRLHQIGETADAEQLYRDVIELAPTHPEAWSNLGLALIMRNAHRDAASACRQAIALRADYVGAHLNLIAALDQLGDTEEVIPVYRRTLALVPDRADLWTMLGSRLESQGEADEAGLAFRKAIELDPGYGLAYLSLGRLLHNRGRLTEAVDTYEQAIAVKPDFVEVLSNLGTLLGSLGHYDRAVDISRRAFTLLPDNPEIATNFGVVLQRQGNVNEAATAYRRALDANPNHHSAWANLGVALQEQFRFDEAILAFQRAAAIRPDFLTAIVEIIKMRRHICDWSSYGADWQTLTELLERDEDAIFMLLLMSFPSSSQQQLKCARQFMARLNMSPLMAPAPAHPSRNRKIRIGYLSADYRDHPVGRLLPDLFARHDRSRFEVFGYSLGTDDSGVLRRRIKEACDQFIDLHAVSNQEASARIRADDIDILVDLSGPTSGSRTEIVAVRPAPVQVSYLGWPGSMGADFIDYVIADKILLPFSQQSFYAEKIVHVPVCYQPSDPHRVPSPAPLSRSDCQLPEDAFVFCSFNNIFKLTPEVFDLWMRLLQRVSNSVLWLYSKSPQTIENLRRRAEQSGVSAERLIFASVTHMNVYLSRLRLADLFLDSNPYNAGATCNDALWVGLPVLTCAGETYVSRMAASLLTAAGLPELITSSTEDYEALAVRLASQPGLLAGLRRRLVENRDRLALFDMATLTDGLERAYEQMVEKSRRGEAPEGFAVEDLKQAVELESV